MDERPQSEGAVTLSLDDVIITEELTRRPARAPDYAAENRALAALAEGLTTDPSGVMQNLPELVLRLCHADSAGVSILEHEGGEEVFRWHAAAGALAHNLHGTMPRSASPCGTVVARNCVLLFNRAERFFTALRGIEPRVYENLLAPWEVNGEVVGTVWAIKHTPEGRFDDEDARLLRSLARFAGAAHSCVQSAHHASEERVAAINLMEDAVIARREAEQAYVALRESEQHLRLATKAAGLFGWSVDVATGRISLSGDVEGVMGFSEPPLDDVMARIERYAVPEDGARHREALLRTMRGGGDLHTVTRVLHPATGELVWIEAHATLLRAPDGTPLRVVGVGVNITERKRAEEVMRESEQWNRLIVEGALDYVIFTTDPEGLITSWSPGAETVFGWTSDEAIGRPLDVTFTPEDRTAGVPELERAAAGENGSAADVRWHLRRDGRRVFIEGVTRALRDGAGGVRGFLKVGRDVTERQRAEEALRLVHEELEEKVRERTLELAEANVSLQAEVRERRVAEASAKQLLRQLVTVQEEERRRIARELHDTLGQQLTALRLSIDIIRAESEGRARLGEHIGRAQSIFDRLNTDVDFLAWELRPTALDMLGLDAALGNFVREWSEHFGVEVHYHGSGPDAPRLPPEVETNLYRIVQEALQNIHKHAGADRVSVLLQQRDERAVLVVEDNGRGYDPEEVVSAGGNKGMGVTNMMERAALIGGELEIESSPGAGTTIYVRVPVGKGEGT